MRSGPHTPGQAGRYQKGHHHGGVHGGLGLGLGRPPPLEAAIASEFSDVDSNIVMAGGVTAANLPQEARNLRRSSSTSTGCGTFSSGVIFVTMIPMLYDAMRHFYRRA
jgi:hypothetical protein